MAKGIGLIGNFKGKVGNMVGYQLSDSNTGNSQGIRVYQPNVKNPKTAAQAEQRAKLAPINATYRALKSIIDRGNEGLPYGNKSRLAWLKQAFKAEHMPWLNKGALCNWPVGCVLTKGSLPAPDFSVTEDEVIINCNGVTGESDVSTIGKVSTLLLAGCPSLKKGDQLTIICVGSGSNALVPSIRSFILDPTSQEATSFFSASADELWYNDGSYPAIASVIVSRQGANGEHLRSNSSLAIFSGLLKDAPYTDASKTAAIESYMASDAVNSDWAEESIQ